MKWCFLRSCKSQTGCVQCVNVTGGWEAVKKKIKTKEGVMWSWTFWGGVWESEGEECRAAGGQNVNVREVFHARLNKSCEVVREAGVRSCSSCSYCIMTLNYSCLPHCGSGSLVSIFGLNSTSTVFPLFCFFSFILFFSIWNDCVANSLHTDGFTVQQESTVLDWFVF